MTFLLRFGAVGGLLGGLAIGIPGALESFLGKTAPTSFVLGYSSFLALPLLVALYLCQAGPAGRLGRIGYATNLIGTGTFGAAAYTVDTTLIHLDHATVLRLLHGPARIALYASATLFVVGAILFGASMIRARVHPRVPAWGYAVILPVFALSAPLPYSPYKGILHVLAAAVLIWLSATLPRVPASPPAPVPVPAPPASPPVPVPADQVIR